MAMWVRGEPFVCKAKIRQFDSGHSFMSDYYDDPESKYFDIPKKNKWYWWLPYIGAFLYFLEHRGMVGNLAAYQFFMLTVGWLPIVIVIDCLS